MALESRSKSKTEWRQKPIVAVCKMYASTRPSYTTPDGDYLRPFNDLLESDSSSNSIILDSHNALSLTDTDAILFTAPRARWYAVNLTARITGSISTLDETFAVAFQCYFPATSTNVPFPPYGYTITPPMENANTTGYRQLLVSLRRVLFLKAGEEIIPQWTFTSGIPPLAISSSGESIKIDDAVFEVSSISDEYQ